MRPEAGGLPDGRPGSWNVVIDGTQHAADRHLKRTLCGPGDTYHRLQPDMPGDGRPSERLDDASEENIQALEELAESFLDEHREQVQAIASQLSNLVADRAEAGRRSARKQPLAST